MESAPLKGARRRLDRAWVHIESLDAEMRSFNARSPYAYIGDTDSQTGEPVWRASVREQPSSDLSLIVGDCIHSLRAALDNLAWSLAIAGAAPDPPFARTSFPITTTKELFDEAVWKIKDLSDPAKKIVEAVQPYERNPEDPTKSELWILDRLWNDDKHRAPSLVGSSMVQSNLHVVHASGAKGWTPDVRHGPFEDGSELARFRIHEPGPDLRCEVEFEFAADVAIHGGPAAGIPVVHLVSHLYQFMRDEVFPRFEGLDEVRVI